MAREPAVGLRKLADIIHLRSLGHSAYTVASRLGMFPWHVYYVTQFVKVCVSTEELEWIEEEAARHNFSTVGEFIMDVFNRCYEEHYAASRKRKKKVA